MPNSKETASATREERTPKVKKENLSDLEEVINKINSLLNKLSKKKKKNIEKQTGYKFVDEGISSSDMEKIRLEIRKEVSNILRDIWIKRNSWGGR